MTQMGISWDLRAEAPRREAVEKEVLYNPANLIVKVAYMVLCNPANRMTEAYNQAKVVLQKAANRMTEAYNQAKEVLQIY
jgi:hypothetical protein